MTKLPRLLLLTLIGAALLVSLTLPAWSRVLQAQGYGGYVDLQVQLSGPGGAVVAGGPLDLSVETSNAGPDSADAVALTLAADASVRLTSSAGCADSPTFNVRCALGLPLLPGSSLPSAFFGTLDPDARGVAAVGVFASSIETDLVPGNEIDVIGFPIMARRDLSALLLSPVPETLSDGRLQWQVELANFGPSSARQISVSTSSYSANSEPAEQVCQSIGAALCPEQSPDGGFLMPGARLVYSITLPALSEANPANLIALSLWSSEGEETGSEPNDVYFSFGDALFADGGE